MSDFILGTFLFLAYISLIAWGKYEPASSNSPTAIAKAAVPTMADYAAAFVDSSSIDTDPWFSTTTNQPWENSPVRNINQNKSLLLALNSKAVERFVGMNVRQLKLNWSCIEHLGISPLISMEN